MVDLHRHFSLLALIATAVHGTALLLDTTVDVSPLALVVPGLVPYRPDWTGIGVVVAEMALLVHLSFRFRSASAFRCGAASTGSTYAVFVGGAITASRAAPTAARPGRSRSTAAPSPRWPASPGGGPRPCVALRRPVRVSRGRVRLRRWRPRAETAGRARVSPDGWRRAHAGLDRARRRGHRRRGGVRRRSRCWARPGGRLGRLRPVARPRPRRRLSRPRRP